ncbi:MAG TPA: histidine--tRNA ligase [Candidatus Saccharimonadales bacterium]
MRITQPRIPSGFPEYLPSKQIEFNRLLGIVREIYELHGFSPVDTVGVEIADVLLAKSGGDTAKEVYRFTKGTTELALPFDQTVPLARYVAQHQNELVFPFRAYQISRVHRGERSQAGRFREFYQCDIDVIGSHSPIIDAEFPIVINKIFERFNFGEFTIRINDRRILNGFFASLGQTEKATDIMRAVDKVEKLGPEQFRAELTALGLSSSIIDQLLEFIAIKGSNDTILEQLKPFAQNSTTLQEGLASLQTLVDALRAAGMPEHRFQIDLKIARGLDYYTGTVYETILNDYPGIGSVCSGGRYDNLTGHYSTTELPGVGISIGLTRLFYQLIEAKVIMPTKQSLAEVVVVPLSDAEMNMSLTIAGQLRDAGIPVIVYTEPGKIKKKLQYVNRMGAHYALIIGEQEQKNNQIQVKDMFSGKSVLIEMSEISQFLGSQL